MGMPAVGGYLAVMRKARGLSQEDLAQRLGVRGKTISDWERGQYAPASDVLARVVALVAADARDVQALFIGDGSAEDGRSLAERRLSGTQSAELTRSALADMDDAALEAAIRERLNQRLAEGDRQTADAIWSGLRRLLRLPAPKSRPHDEQTQ